SEKWLAGGLGLVPLAPLADIGPAHLPDVIAQMKERIDRDATPGLAAELWSAAYILMGLRYQRAVIEKLLQGVVAMKESVTYQAIIEEGLKEGLKEGLSQGEIKEARKILLLQGRRRFGEPSERVIAAIDALTDVDKLEVLTVRLLETDSWE